MFFVLQYYLWVNVAGFVVATFDKFVAWSSKVFGMRRVSESTLLLLAASGAFPGESISFIMFNHKTRKDSFRRSFVFATAIHLFLFLAGYPLGFWKYLA